MVSDKKCKKKINSKLFTIRPVYGYYMRKKTSVNLSFVLVSAFSQNRNN